MAKRPLIQCIDLTVKIGNETIFKNLDLEVEEGKHILVQGPSGSGKSTFLKVLLGFVTPDSGSLRYKGKSADKGTFKLLRGNSGWLPQDLDLGSETVINVMKKPFEFRANENRQPDQAAIDVTIRKLGLAPGDLNKQYTDLSTGQRQRIGIAVCHLLNKPIMMLDEPTSALDRASKQKAADLLLVQDRTIISISHDPFWMEKADQILSLD